MGDIPTFLLFIISIPTESLDAILQYLPNIEKLLISYRNGELFTVVVRGDKIYIGELTIEELTRTISFITLFISGTYKRYQQYKATRKTLVKHDDRTMNEKFKALSTFMKIKKK